MATLHKILKFIINFFIINKSMKHLMNIMQIKLYNQKISLIRLLLLSKKLLVYLRECKIILKHILMTILMSLILFLQN